MASIKTANNILQEIDNLVNIKNISYMDACLHYCERNNIEPDFIGELIKSSSLFKSRLQSEAEDLNFLPKSIRLPI